MSRGRNRRVLKVVGILAIPIGLLMIYWGFSTLVANSRLLWYSTEEMKTMQAVGFFAFMGGILTVVIGAVLSDFADSRRTRF